MEEGKELRINVPKGYEIDKENSTFECIKFKKKQELTYGYIANELFGEGKTAYLTDIRGDIINESMCFSCNPNNCASRMQDKELLLYNVLINVSKYMNDGLNPDFNDTNESKQYVYYRLGEFIKNSIC